MASRLERLVSIDALIRAGNYPSVQKLCEMFEVQPRTIYQDLRELREMFGLDIQFDRERNGYHNVDPSKQLPPLAMTYEEALLLTLAIEMLASSFGPSFRGALARAAEMVKSNDDDRFSWVRDLVALEKRAACEVKCSVLIEVLRAAIKRQKVTLILSEGRERKIVTQPLRVMHLDGHWHLVADVDHNGDGHSERKLEMPLCKVSDVQTQGDEEK